MKRAQEAHPSATANPNAVPESKEQQLAAIDLQTLDVGVEIDKLHKYLGQQLLERNYGVVSGLIPQITRRWDTLARLLIQRDKIESAPLNAGKAPKSAPFDYTRPGYEYD